MSWSKKMEYTVDACYFLIEFVSSNQISIKVFNFKEKKEFCSLIDDTVLQQSRKSPQQLYQCLYRQYIYDGKVPKKLIKIDKEFLTITCDFPKAPISSLKVDFKETDTDQATFIIEKMKNYLEECLSRIETSFKALEEKLILRIQQKAQLLILQLQTILSKKQEQLQQFIQAEQLQCLVGFQKTTDECVNRILEDTKVMKEQAKLSLIIQQGNIVKLNQNILFLSKRLDQLEDEFQLNKQGLSDEIDKMNYKLDNFSSQLQEKVKNILKEAQIQRKLENCPLFAQRRKHQEKYELIVDFILEGRQANQIFFKTNLDDQKKLQVTSESEIGYSKKKRKSQQSISIHN